MPPAVNPAAATATGAPTIATADPAANQGKFLPTLPGKDIVH